jgi:hypothetical protein
MQCPVCGAEAEDLTAGDFDGLVVRCKRCGEYEVVGGAVNDLVRLDYDARVAALDQAKSVAAPQARPAITPTAL